MFVEQNKKISMPEVLKSEKFWVFRNTVLLKEHLVYVKNEENESEVVGTLSSEVIKHTISTIKERNRIEIEKRKDKERQKIKDLLERIYGQMSMVVE